MQEYEYLDSGGRVICRLHDRLRCDECFYVTELQEQNKRYREAIKRAIGKFNYDEHQEGMSILQKALEGEE